MLTFKKEVTAFIYDSQFGEVKTIFNEPLNEGQINVINKTLDEWGILVNKEDNINELFECYSKEELDSNCEGLNKVFDWAN